MADLDDFSVDLSLVGSFEAPGDQIDDAGFLESSLPGASASFAEEIIETRGCTDTVSQRPRGRRIAGHRNSSFCLSQTSSTLNHACSGFEGIFDEDEEKVEWMQVPCPARNMPPNHDAKTAFFSISSKTKHAELLQCSHPTCRNEGAKYRFCAECLLPVPRRNFRDRHMHRRRSSKGEPTSKVHAPLWRAAMAGKSQKNRCRSLERKTQTNSIPLIVSTPSNNHNSTVENPSKHQIEGDGMFQNPTVGRKKQTNRRSLTSVECGFSNILDNQTSTSIHSFQLNESNKSLMTGSFGLGFSGDDLNLVGDVFSQDGFQEGKCQDPDGTSHTMDSRPAENIVEVKDAPFKSSNVGESKEIDDDVSPLVNDGQEENDAQPAFQFDYDDEMLSPIPLAPEVEKRHKNLARGTLDELLGEDYDSIGTIDGSICDLAGTNVKSQSLPTESARPIQPHVATKNHEIQPNLQIGSSPAFSFEKIKDEKSNCASSASSKPAQSPLNHEGVGLNSKCVRETVNLGTTTLDLWSRSMATNNQAPFLQLETTGMASASTTPENADKPTEIVNANMTRKADSTTPKQKGRKKQKDQESNEKTALVGMGFFSQLQENGLFDEVKGITSEKKKKVVRRRRKPKPDLLKDVSMGFFSGGAASVSTTQEEVPSKRRIVEVDENKDLSSHLQPLYNWAPALTEGQRYAMEYSLPIVVPGVAVISKYSSYAYIYCFILPILHTFETMFTTFGPNSSRLHLKFAPITPMVHLWCDLLLLHPICMAMFLWPHLYGPYAYTQGAVLLLLEFIYWAVAYKDIVVKRKSDV